MNTIQSQFRQALKREGKTITTYYTNETYPCLFRRINDNNNTTNHIQIFYEKDIPIHQGQLLTYGGKHFITLNKESVENDVYYKSSVLECNLLLPVTVSSVRQYIPCYIYDLTSPTVVSSNIITTLDGRGEIITESTDIINNIPLDIKVQFNILGGWFDLKNRHMINGITHLFIERGLEPPKTYKFDITTDTNIYEIDTTTQIVPVPVVNDVIDDTATITYVSSDELIATVDENGLVTFIAEGSVTITATWVEQNKTDTVNLIVENSAPPVDATYSTIDTDEVIIGTTTRIIPTFYDSIGVKNTSVVAVWSITKPSGFDKDFTITFSGNNCDINVKDNFNLIGKDLIINLSDGNGRYLSHHELPITMGW